ncbi:dUTP pyrophosphatase [Nematocida sp. ERTm5]|nr:dUTP pyrophosphatase [Nematocida sp. AWRm79]KAI5186400.1 dUTP pyrophosphatase [Nematocida sp. AWRm78]OAG29872.1 dUTP pyrophosphatase [Nematocida sp. ERTm5]
MTKEREEFKVKLLNDNATCPRIATSASAGYDLYAMKDGVIEPGTRQKIDLGCSIEIPEGYYGQICSRSSLSFKYGIMSMAGVIDSDYRGELAVLLYNSGNEPFKYLKGDRIAQMVIIKIFTEQPILVTEVSTTDRSSGGFGSTGN